MVMYIDKKYLKKSEYIVFVQFGVYLLLYI